MGYGTKTNKKNQTEEESVNYPKYVLILLNDDNHTYDYVVRMLVKLLKIDEKKAFSHASEVDKTGQSILICGTLEYLEFKKEQIENHGPDPLSRGSKTSMSCKIESA